ncbi:DUF3386 domain-containing protein [Synechococcus sp. RSCCF101]|uniref:DUF3386 domain-containing protein n=1 Tax=Synechococcus sp. RSCCF101 TaxID=2511069 RepID=UPI0012477737|nr:DUF3386 domain-containing protein [Synechococcus sp. RSCCF101]QEY31884.1 DUF3386 domain-containing protein [Synechococcus sp. RSCCF101]
MTTTASPAGERTEPTAVVPGSDVRELFRAAYENRYTWAPGFQGYAGTCQWQQGERSVEGRFRVGADLKGVVEGVDDAEVSKAIGSQLWEVCIHRVRRPFDQVHGENGFTAGDRTDEGLEVLISGKGEGDRYRIRDNVVTMVHRHIHGTVVTIHTGSITDTGSGYLSRTYTSRYADPASGAPRGGQSAFTDTFVQLPGSDVWVLAERRIDTDAHNDQPAASQTFRFSDLQAL